MKSFKEITKEINETNNKLCKLSEEIRTLRWSHRNIETITADELIKFNKEREEKLTSMYEEEEYLKLKLPILKNNARIILYNEVMPGIIEVLRKYKGKPYGHKTKEKIKDEIKEKYNCNFYISSSYSNEYHIYPLDIHIVGDDLQLEVYSYDRNKYPLLNGNKIRIVEMENLYLLNKHNYIEDVDRHIATMKNAWEEVYKAKQQFEEKLAAYNQLTVHGIKEVYSNHLVYRTISV